jgi:hypothetical protein
MSYKIDNKHSKFLSSNRYSMREQKRKQFPIKCITYAGSPCKAYQLDCATGMKSCHHNPLSHLRNSRSNTATTWMVLQIRTHPEYEMICLASLPSAFYLLSRTTNRHHAMKIDFLPNTDGHLIKNLTTIWSNVWPWKLQGIAEVSSKKDNTALADIHPEKP